MTRALRAALIIAAIAIPASAQAADKWITSWVASAQGPYPVGNPSAQPVLKFAFPTPEAGARDQTFRLVLMPEIWGKQARVRFTNVYGVKPVTIDGAYAALQLGSAALVAGTSRPVTFGGKPSITIEPGKDAWSDAVALPFVKDAKALTGRKLALSFHVAGESGPMTWHAKALQTSYVTAPGAGAKGQQEDEASFPYSTASWYFVDAIDMMAPSDTKVIVAFGDSITDGTASTMNGDDRWPNVLSRRLHAAGVRAVVLNAGIGGNQVVGPAEYSAQKPYAGGPSAGSRIERDVIGLSGVTALIWLEGINDFSKAGNASTEAVQTGMKEIAARVRAKVPGIRLIGATLATALHSTNAAHGSPEQDVQRKALNEFIRTSGVFDGVADFDKVTLDAATGEMKAEFVPESTTGGPGDKLHPNRAGYLGMANAIDLDLLLGKKKETRASR
ncbi:MAG: lysophospholipase [Alphaproteobacteria bacterium]|nr:lysophospholipase [Alphaproteobacteria bacterium]